MVASAALRRGSRLSPALKPVVRVLRDRRGSESYVPRVVTVYSRSFLTTG